MPATYVYKAQGARGKKGIFLTPQEDARSNPFAVLPDGRRIEGKYQNTNEGRHQYLFGSDILNQKGVKIEYSGKTINLEDANKSYEGSNPYDGWKYRNKGDLGQASSGGGGQSGGVPPGQPDNTPTQIGFGVVPANMLPYFPDPSLIKYDPITGAPYNYVNPEESAAKTGEFNREQVRKNLDLSKDIALQQLDTELQGLGQFVPGASNLKRQEAGRDNIFNQGERDAQINSVLPDARRQYGEQGARAEAFASGRAPDSITDRGLELTTRSVSADRASAGGFGANSSVAKKASDLMSAEQRIRLSQYGDQLLTSNSNESAKLFLAPTSYSDASQQVRVTPEVGAGRLQGQALSEINSLSTINPATSLQAQIGQNQFTTSLEQQTRMFNATNDLNAQQFNANTQNQFALNKFGYMVSYAGAVAGAAQTDINTQLGIAQQGASMDAFKEYLAATQSANESQSISSGLGSLGSMLQGMNLGGDTTGGGKGLDTSGLTNSDVPSGDLLDINNPNPFSSTSAQLQPSSIPIGSAPSQITGSQQSGSVSAPIPNQQLSGDVGNFVRDVGVGQDVLYSDSNKAVTQSLLNASAPILGNTGIYSTPQPQSALISTSGSGAPVYMSVPLLKSQDSSLGARFTDGMTQGISPLGVVEPGSEDSNNLAELSEFSRNPEIVGRLDSLAEQSPKEFVTAMTELTGGEGDLKAQFTAYQMQQNWGTMSSAQKSLAISNMGMQNFKFEDGSNLSTKPLIKNVDGKTEFTLGQAVDMLNKGTNAYALKNNYDELKRLNAIAGGDKNSDPYKIANGALGLDALGYGKEGNEVPGITKESLAKDGWNPAPHLGVGAITSTNKYTKLPKGYTNFKTTDGTTIAVPKGTSASAQGAFKDSLVGTGAGIGGISGNALKVYKGWEKLGSPEAMAALTKVASSSYRQDKSSQGVVPKSSMENEPRVASKGVYGGSALVKSISGLDGTNNFLLGGVVAGSLVKHYIPGQDSSSESTTYRGQSLQNASLVEGAPTTVIADEETSSDINTGKVIVEGTQDINNIIQDDNLTNEEKSQGVQRRIGTGVAEGFTGIPVTDIARNLEERYPGTKKNIDRIDADLNPATRVFGKGYGFSSSKSGGQQDRDAIRITLQEKGVVDKDFSFTLPDGTVANIGVDGKGGRHKNAKGEEINSYDIDFENDLDYVAGMGGITMSRILNGRTGTDVDQMGGQLGNGTLSNIGFNKEMSPENFAKLQENQRAIYAQSGIKSKADGYQLANQAFAEGRITESDLVTMHQTFNMMYDKDGYSTAQKLMAGRKQGAEATKVPVLDKNGIQVGYRPQLPKLPGFLEKWVDRGEGYAGDKEPKKKKKKKHWGQIIGGIGGAIIGGIYGGPGGATAGASVGSSIGSSIDQST